MGHTQNNTGREAITYAPNLDVLLRLADSYVGNGATLACSGCDYEVWTGDEITHGTPQAREDMAACIVALFQHTAFEHGARYDVVLVRTTVELVWEA